MIQHKSLIPKASVQFNLARPPVRNKRKAAIIAALLFAAAFPLSAEAPDTLDSAIQDAVPYLSGQLAPKTIIAVLNFTAPPAVSSYVIEELTSALVNSGNFIMVDRQNLELLRREMEFQLSGEVSDESAQKIGMKLGAQTIITGTLSAIGDRWRFQLRALEVETAKIQGIMTRTVKKDRVLSGLLPRTTAQKLGTGALNLAFGLGSWLDGDTWGGATVTAGYGVGIALLIWELAGMTRDSPGSGVPGAIGISLMGVSAGYGFLRPFIYRPFSAASGTAALSAAPAAALPHEAFDISLTAARQGGAGLRLTYTHRY